MFHPMESVQGPMESVQGHFRMWVVLAFGGLIWSSWPFSPSGPTCARGNDAIVEAADYASLQDAADAIPKTGGILRIGPGRFELSKPLHLKTGDTRVEGAGAATHLVNTNSEGLPAILVEHPEFPGKTVPGQDRLWRVNFANLRITGNEKSGVGIHARYIEEIFLHGVTVSGHGGDGIFLEACYEDPRISDCLVTYNGGAGLKLVECHDIVVNANQFEENRDGVRCEDSFNLTMNGNNLDDHLRDGVVIENTYGSVLSGNMIEECQGWAVVIDRDCYGITISANVIAHEFTGGIDLRDAHGCAVSANTFTIVKNVGLAIRKGSGAITVSGNNFSDSWIGRSETGQVAHKRDLSGSKAEAKPNDAAGILLEGCEAAVISGNLFSGLSGKSVDQRGDCRKILIQGNGQQDH